MARYTLWKVAQWRPK